MSRFGTAGIRGPVSEVPPEFAARVGRAAALAHPTEFVTARDGRLTGGALADALAAGLRSGGADVCRAGQLPTPALSYASCGRRGVVVTASHNPPTDNGIKLFVDGREYDADAEAAVESRLDTDPAPWDRWGDAGTADVLEEYRAAVVEYAADHGDSPDLTVVTDCGNGMAALAVPQVLDRGGADVTTLHADVDGRFRGRASKPTPESVADLRSLVPEVGATLGVAHDGDADRVAVVGLGGEVVHEDTVLAVLAEHYVRRHDASQPVVVTTPNASGRVDDRVTAAGGRVERTALGTLREGIARAEGPVAFAAEPWKHVHPEFGGWIDGVASAAVVARLVAAAGGVGALTDPVEEHPYRKEAVDCPEEAKPDAMARLRESVPDTFPEADVSTDHGVRADLPDGSWLLVRPSGTEPVVRVYVESEDADTLLESVRGLVTAAVADTG
jgi:phosphomannomutase